MCLFIISNGASAASTNDTNKANNGESVSNNNSNNSTTNNNNNNNNSESKSENVDPKMETPGVAVEVEEEQPQITNDGAMFVGQKPDSTNINSVSKFNFIFYFIYKLKYDEDPNGVGHMNYEF